MRFLPLALLVVSSAGGVALLACSDDSSTSPTGSCGAGACPSSANDTTDGGGTVDEAGDAAVATLYPADTTKVVARAAGGLPIIGADGSNCSPTDSTYTYVVATGNLSWKLCTTMDGGLYQYVEGHRVLDDFEKIHVTSAFESLTRNPEEHPCVADGVKATVTFSTPSGDKTFVDANGACGDDIAVDHMDAIFGQFDSLTRN